MQSCASTTFLAFNGGLESIIIETHEDRVSIHVQSLNKFLHLAPADLERLVEALRFAAAGRYEPANVPPVKPSKPEPPPANGNGPHRRTGMSYHVA